MFIIGELINGMYKDIGKAIKEKNKAVIQKCARDQVQAGADALDLNCGPASRDQVTDLKWLVETVQEAVDVTLALDSTKPGAIEEALKFTKKKAIINSTSADKEKLDILIPLAARNKTYLIGLALDKKGVPKDKDGRLELAATIVSACQEQGFPIDDLYLDPIVLPAKFAQNQLADVLISLKEFKIISEPAPKTVIGLSNVSQSSCNRNLVNRTFLVMAAAYGLDAAILDPLDKDLMDALITSELILNKQIYCDSFLEAYRKKHA
jgi:5-methyltetrahydrofolate corrinoid/iron sulfur protein methyltransferase